MVWSTNQIFGGNWDGDWFMVKDRVWRAAQKDRPVRFLCVRCLERRIGRRLTARDFKRFVKINFVGDKSAILRKRMRGLKPARRLRNTSFKWSRLSTTA
jgi:hypothetical protein